MWFTKMLLLFSFNTCLSKTRCRVECVIGMMKRKFPCLSKRIDYQPDKVAKIIKSVAFLWNFGLIAGDNKGYDPDLYVVEDEDDLRAELQSTAAGRMRRDLLADYLWDHKRQNRMRNN